MKWDYYSKRRNVSLVDLIKLRDVESYEMLKTVLGDMGVEPPELGMYQSAYAIAFPPIPKVQKPKPKPKSKSVAKPAAKSTTSPSKKSVTRKRTSKGN